ncbi:DNA replication/repair protein RecF [Segnochrobactraceae bacterium EtOH-i3]
MGIPSEGARVRVAGLRLTDFRNHQETRLDAGAGHVVLVGENGAGKTNLIEAVSFLSPGRGLRRATLEEPARKGGPGGWVVSADVEGVDRRVTIGTGIEPPAGSPPRARKLRIDGADAGTVDALLDHLSVLWLTPAMDGLFTGAASDRRRFLDRMVLAIDPGHARRAIDYEKALRERNRLLEGHRPDMAWLDAIELEIATLGVALAAARRELVDCFRDVAGGSAEAGSAFPAAGLALNGSLETELQDWPATEVEDRFRQRLASGRHRDAAAGRTLEGPHRTDLVVTHLPKAMPAADSSTGEQKALLIGLVLAHARLVAGITRRTPVLLMDEVAAHLDARRRAGLFAELDALGAQVWMTGTDPALFAELGDRGRLFRVADGAVFD